MPDHGGGPRPRPIPQRTCIACRQREGKRGLLRIVRTPDGKVTFDPTGKANGRGAYLHESRGCWEKALKRGTIAVALKVSPAQEDVDALRSFSATLPTDGGIVE